jgi:predicted small lipoprotein YifL
MSRLSLRAVSTAGAALLIGMTMMLAGCGQKGPLYPPDAENAAPAENAAEPTDAIEPAETADR